MFNRVKNALYNVVGGLDALPAVRDGEAPGDGDKLPLKFKYTRPSFLQLTTDDEVQVSADHVIRPIIVPRDISKIPWNAGYAETINAGKSLRNEDQAAVYRGAVRRGAHGDGAELPWVYFALFDGHAGSGVAVAASNVLQRVLQDKLMSVMELLVPDGGVQASAPEGGFLPFGDRKITADSLVIGALETAFWDMDQQIARDKKHYKMTGGCTVLVALFILGKLYLANAGDSRAIICRGEQVIPMSCDFTPETERSRIKHLGMQCPELLGSEFTHLEFVRRPVRADLGKRLLCRDAFMTGWNHCLYASSELVLIWFKHIMNSALRALQSRVLATIGVTRGFGDHDLKAQSSNVDIKPFLTPEPEVRIFDVCGEELTDGDVLVMGTDGLWDVLPNDRAAQIVLKSLDHFPASDTQRFKFRYISAAQDLVMHSRGKLKERSWRTVDNRAATIDDISVFVIPLRGYQDEHRAWMATTRQQSEPQVQPQPQSQPQLQPLPQPQSQPPARTSSSPQLSSPPQPQPQPPADAS
ncbi:hypothetical protein HPB50_027466 [Hyalomma asiaticum]|uniref:Uncharacterized protein n=1 Tax=Hyalomma asiaticum TaxID=266040 RepID=A0ACB7S6P3_HYAAI|nr:hypothetical protein HPB50_027466 [Hyalomma asiaticum]